MLEDKKPKDEPPLQDLQTPQPIEILIEGYYVTLSKGATPITKLNIEDSDTLLSSITLLSGLLRADCCKGEIEMLRDLLGEILEK